MLKAMSSSSSAFIWGKWLRESFIGRYYTHRRQGHNRLFRAWQQQKSVGFKLWGADYWLLEWVVECGMFCGYDIGG